MPQSIDPLSQSTSAAQSPTAEPDLSTVPHALPLPPSKAPETAILESDIQSRHGDMSYAFGKVVLTYGDHILHADTLTYNHATDDVTADGHVELTGGENDEHIEATHGTYNLRTATGRFYDVHGSVGKFHADAAPVVTTTNAGIASGNSSHVAGYQNSNPFLFEGRIVVKSGPMDYTVYNGSVTTCLLPHPDWQIVANKIAMNNGKATAAYSTFRVLSVPLLFLPYVSHPVDSQQRQSGFLIPALGYSSASKGTGSKGVTVGEQYYLVLGPSADLTLGILYYSLRGYSENGSFRYRGSDDNYFNVQFSALQDRGFYAPGINAQGASVSVFNNQGGVDITASFHRRFSPHVRAAGDAEYLSSFIYREVFTNNFNQSVSTDINSVVYLTDQKNGYSADARVDRYEGLKIVQTDFSPSEEIKIYHAPSIDFTGLDHPIPGTPLFWSVSGSSAGLKRVQPNFATAGITWRFDLSPQVSLPLRFEGWHAMATAGVRETAYSRSREAPYSSTATPIEQSVPINRMDVNFTLDLRPPAVERTFTVPARWRRIFGDQVRHTIEPEITYRNVRGISNFLNVLRFDTIDLASDTNELQYGVTQHLYFRPHTSKPTPAKPGCPATPSPANASTSGFGSASQPTPAADALNPDERASPDVNGVANVAAAAPDLPLRTHPRKPDPCAPSTALPPQQEWFSWVLTQKHFFDPTFGNAVIDKRRNIFDTTLDFSGIAFLTRPSNTSPLKSRMRFRTSSHADIAWDFDFDTRSKKFLSSNTFLDLHQGRFFGGFSYARLNAPGRTYSEVVNYTTNIVTALTSSPIANFSQTRFLLGYGEPNQAGLSSAVSAGIDLSHGSAQYISVQANYNWNCCGLAVEYRRYSLGTIRDESAYSFNFTLANIGTAGSLRRAESLF